ncbi:MAG: cytochrome b N-terminal domain-containing protein [Thermoanaerobaculia bacterium]|nr:cytochrome b N-terminal domain-containing protein [Thermoanaerobaculia bacterium]
MAAPATDGERARTVVGTFVLHLRPVRVPLEAIRFTHTFGLGGASLVLLGVLAVTGSLLMLGYTPVPGDAWASIDRLESEVPFGAFVRALHHWSANLLVLVAGLHLLRVFFTGGYLEGRELNWVVGLVLFAAIAASAFTGYLLPWDQLAYWAVTIVTGMAAYVPLGGPALASLLRGGEEIGPATLGTYYALHTQWLPALLFAGAGFHFWRVRKAGGVVVPPHAVRDEKGRPVQVLFLPELLWRETAAALVLLAALTTFSALVRAPLGPAANPGLSLDPAKAPWYFLGFQELLVHLHPLFAVVVVPLSGALALVSLPWLGFPRDEPRGAWFLSETGRRTARFAALSALVVTPLLVLADAAVLGVSGAASGGAAIVTRGVLPTAVLLAACAAGFRVLRSRSGATCLEATQALFVFLAVAFAVLTATGIWFRGAGMALVWPWQA